MEKSLRLRKNRDYQKVYKKGRSYWNRQFTLLVLKNNLNSKRIGFTVTKKYGSAVKRNNIKRRLKEILRNNKDTLAVGYDYIFVPRQNTYQMDFKDLTRSLLHLISLINKKNNKPKTKKI